MSWIRFDDHYRNHDKIVFAGKAGRDLHTAMIFWCAENLTDGRIHINQIRKIALADEIDDWEHALSLLMTIVSGYENPLVFEEEDGFYRLHDYLKYQPSRKDVLGLREETSRKRAEAGRIGGIRSADARKANCKQIASKLQAKGQAKPTKNNENFKQNEAPDSRIPNPEESHKNEILTPFNSPLAIAVYLREYKKKFGLKDDPSIISSQAAQLREWGEKIRSDTLESAIVGFFQTDDERVIKAAYPVGYLVRSTPERWIDQDGKPKLNANNFGRNGKNGNTRNDGSGVRATDADATAFEASFARLAEADLS